MEGSDLVSLSCASCAIEFAISPAFEERRRDDNATFYCPNGHGQSYVKPKGDSPEVKKLKEQIANLQAQVTTLQQKLSDARRKHYDQKYVDWLEEQEHATEEECREEIDA